MRPRPAGADSAPGSPSNRGPPRRQAVPEVVRAAGGAGRGGRWAGPARQPCLPGSQEARAAGAGGGVRAGPWSSRPQSPPRASEDEPPAPAARVSLPGRQRRQLAPGAGSPRVGPGLRRGGLGPRGALGLGAADSRWVIAAGAGGAAPGLVCAPGSGTPRHSGRDPGRGAVLGSGAGGSPRPPCEWVGAGVGAGLGRRALEPDGFPGVASGQAPRPGRGKGARPRGGGGGGV